MGKDEAARVGSDPLVLRTLDVEQLRTAAARALAAIGGGLLAGPTSALDRLVDAPEERLVARDGLILLPHRLGRLAQLPRCANFR